MIAPSFWPLLAFGLPGHGEWLILLFLGLLIFGRRLPEVGRSIGRSIVEFKRGIKGINDDIDDESSKPSPSPERLVDKTTEPRVAASQAGESAAGTAEPQTYVESATKLGQEKAD